MTIDERHEALTQTVELMVHMHQEDYTKNQILMAQLMEAVISLARIAQAHEQRISGLESR